LAKKKLSHPGNRGFDITTLRNCQVFLGQNIQKMNAVQNLLESRMKEEDGNVPDRFKTSSFLFCPDVRGDPETGCG
jgi:hypothetical protein